MVGFRLLLQFLSVIGRGLQSTSSVGLSDVGVGQVVGNVEVHHHEVQCCGRREDVPPCKAEGVFVDLVVVYVHAQ